MRKVNLWNLHLPNRRTNIMTAIEDRAIHLKSVNNAKSFFRGIESLSPKAKRMGRDNKQLRPLTSSFRQKENESPSLRVHTSTKHTRIKFNLLTKEINQENSKIYERLVQVKPQIDFRRMNVEYSQSVKYGRMLECSKYLGVDFTSEAKKKMTGLKFHLKKKMGRHDWGGNSPQKSQYRLKKKNLNRLSTDHS